MLSFYLGKLHRAYEKVLFKPTGWEEGTITIFASQKYSRKVQDRMNSLFLKRKEFKEDEVRKTWKSYVKFPGVLMVKKPTDEKYKVFDCDS